MARQISHNTSRPTAETPPATIRLERAGSATNLRSLKIIAVPLHFSINANTPTGRLIQNTHAQGMRCQRVNIITKNRLWLGRIWQHGRWCVEGRRSRRRQPVLFQRWHAVGLCFFSLFSFSLSVFCCLHREEILPKFKHLPSTPKKISGTQANGDAFLP